MLILFKYLIIMCVVGFFGSSVFPFLFFTCSCRSVCEVTLCKVASEHDDVFWEAALLNGD